MKKENGAPLAPLPGRLPPAAFTRYGPQVNTAPGAGQPKARAIPRPGTALVAFLRRYRRELEDFGAVAGKEVELAELIQAADRLLAVADGGRW